MSDEPSLDEFAASDPVRTGSRSYLDTLPDDIREQLLASTAGHSTAARWLKSLGFERASQQMVQIWRAKNRSGE